MNFEPILYGPLFSRDAQDVNLVAAGADPIDVTVSVGGSSWTVPVTPALTDGRYVAPLRMREILESVALPLGLQEPGVVDVPAITLSAGGASMSFRTIRGAAAGKTPAQLVGHWLSWRDQISKTYTWGRERLTFLAGLDLLGWRSGTYGVSAKIFLDGSDPVTRTLASGTLQNGCQFITIDASYSTIAALASGRVLAYDLSYSFSGTDSAGVAAAVDGYPLRLVVASPDVRVKEFVFCNGFSVEDRVYSSGRSNPKLEGTAVAFLNGGEESELRNDAEEGKEVYSGYLSSARESALWLDFLKACDRRILLDGIPERIVVDSQESDLQDNALGSVKFAYHLAALDNGRYFNDQEGLGDYDPTQRHGALYIGDEPPSEELPSEDLFFLKTRLDEFPAADLDEELLFLAQNPLTLAWGNASLRGIKEYLQRVITREDVHVWSGPWEDYSVAVAGYALSAALGKALYDRIKNVSPSEEDLKTLELIVGGESMGEFDPAGAKNVSWEISQQDIFRLIGASKYHPYGGDDGEGKKTFKIGGATLTWYPAQQGVPGYFELDSPLVTAGDQVIGGGTPGPGESGGAGYLHELLDVKGNPGNVQRADGTTRADGDLLGYNAALNKWVAVAMAAISPDLSNYYTKSQTDAKVESRVNELLDGAPTAYDTLKEIADYIANDASATAAIVGSLSGKANIADLKKLTLAVGANIIGTFDPVGADDTMLSISQNQLVGLLASAFHPHGGDPTLGFSALNLFLKEAITVGQGATDDSKRRLYFGGTSHFIELHNFGTTDNPVWGIYMNIPLVTAGDQVIGGRGGVTPGGGDGEHVILSAAEWAQVTSPDPTKIYLVYED